MLILQWADHMFRVQGLCILFVGLDRFHQKTFVPEYEGYIGLPKAKRQIKRQ